MCVCVYVPESATVWCARVALRVRNRACSQKLGDRGDISRGKAKGMEKKVGRDSLRNSTGRKVVPDCFSSFVRPLRIPYFTMGRYQRMLGKQRWRIQSERERFEGGGVESIQVCPVPVQQGGEKWRWGIAGVRGVLRTDVLPSSARLKDSRAWNAKESPRRL